MRTIATTRPTPRPGLPVTPGCPAPLEPPERAPQHPYGHDAPRGGREHAARCTCGLRHLPSVALSPLAINGAALPTGFVPASGGARRRAVATRRAEPASTSRAS